MNVEQIRAYLVEQIYYYERIANADKRLTVCRQAMGRLEGLKDLLKKIDGEFK